MTSKQKRKMIEAYQAEHGCTFEEAKKACEHNLTEKQSLKSDLILTGDEVVDFFNDLPPRRRDGYLPDLGLFMRSKGAKGLRLHNCLTHEMKFDLWENGILITFVEPGQDAIVSMFKKCNSHSIWDRMGEMELLENDMKSKYSLATLILRDNSKTPVQQAINEDRWVPLDFELCKEHSLNPKIFIAAA